MSRTWQDNAHEFGTLTKQGYGVRLALLAACSIEKGIGNGRPADAETARGRAVSGRVSVREFARAAGVSDTTVGEHLKKWDRLVEAGWDLDRKGLRPDDVGMVLTQEFISEYNDLTEKRPPTRHLSLDGITEAIRTDPDIRAAAIHAAKVADPDAVLKAGIDGTLHAVTGKHPIYHDVPDPLPSWARYCDRMTSDAQTIRSQIADLRRKGDHAEAAKAQRYYDKAVQNIVVNSTKIPDDVGDLA